MDFADGSVPYWPMFARPGVVAAAANFVYPPQLRELGAQTVYWEMHLRQRVGTPTNPLDPAVVEDWADRVFYRAVASSACATPWIALNEMWGSNLATPWSPTNAQYRQNIIIFVRRLSALGAHPFVLLSTRPFTDVEAGDWWREAALYTDFVRELYFASPLLSRAGPGARLAHLAQLVSPGHHRPDGDRDPALEGRDLPRLPYEPEQGQPRWPEARKRLVRNHQAPGARGQAGEPRDPLRDHLVLGLGRVGSGRPRPGQAGCGVRVSLDAEPQPLRRARHGGARVRAVADGGPAQLPLRGPVQDPLGSDPQRGDLEPDGDHRRSRDRVHVALRQARAQGLRAGQSRGREGCRACDRRQPLRRQRSCVPRRACPRRGVAANRARSDRGRASAGSNRAPHPRGPTLGCGDCAVPEHLFERRRQARRGHARAFMAQPPPSGRRDRRPGARIHFQDVRRPGGHAEDARRSVSRPGSRARPRLSERSRSRRRAPRSARPSFGSPRISPSTTGSCTESKARFPDDLPPGLATRRSAPSS